MNRFSSPILAHGHFRPALGACLLGLIIGIISLAVWALTAPSEAAPEKSTRPAGLVISRVEPKAMAPDQIRNRYGHLVRVVYR